MWGFFIIFSLIFLSSFLFAAPAQKAQNAKQAKFGDFSFPRAGYGDAVPVVWGTVKLKGPATLWYGNYWASAIRKKVSDGGWFGKDKYQTVGYQYYMTVDCLLCTGPGVKLLQFFAGDDLVWEGELGGGSGINDYGSVYINSPNLFGGPDEGGGLVGTLVHYSGSAINSRDPYLAEVCSPDVPAYNSLARVVFRNFYIGTRTTPEAWSFVVQRFPQNIGHSIMPNGKDINPVEALYEALQWSGQYLEEGRKTPVNIENFREAARILYNENLGFSMAVQNSISGEDLLEELSDHMDAIIYEEPSTGEVNIKLLRNDYDVNTLPVLTESEIIEIDEFAKTLWSATFNQVKLSFEDRDNEYQTSVAIAQNFANIETQKQVKSDDLTMTTIYDKDVASNVAARRLGMVSAPLYKLNLKVNRKAHNFRPGDCFILNYAPFGINRLVIRIMKINLGSLENGIIEMEVTQDRFATATTLFAPPPATEWNRPVGETALIETKYVGPAPFFLAKGEGDTPSTFGAQNRVLTLAKKPTFASQQYDAYMVQDDQNVEENTGIPYAPSATFDGNLPESSLGLEGFGIDANLEFVLDNPADVSRLLNFTAFAQASTGSMLLMAGSIYNGEYNGTDGELMAYLNLTVLDQATGRIRLGTIYRNLLDTVRKSYVRGQRFWFVEGNTTILPSIVGPIYQYKLQDRIAGSAYPLDKIPSPQTILTARAGLPLPPQYLTIGGSRAPGPIANSKGFSATWRRRNSMAATISAYNGPDDFEEGTRTQIRWRVPNFNAGAWNTQIVDGTTYSPTLVPETLNFKGTLEVEIRGYKDGNVSVGYDRLTRLYT